MKQIIENQNPSTVFYYIDKTWIKLNNFKLFLIFSLNQVNLTISSSETQASITWV